MSSSLLLRLTVVVLLVALATEVHLISGLDLEETRGPFDMERVSSSSSIGRSSFPQLYNLYMDPVRKGVASSSSSFDVVHPQKRSRLFVGKRFNDDFLSDDEDLILVSDDNDDEPSSFDVKRNHLFVGKRASPRFVGKRSAANQPSRMTRRKRFASNEYPGRGDGKGMVEDSDEGSRMWKLWMAAGTGEEEEGNAAEKRARMFVGKRRQLEADDGKRSRLFVGRRAEAEEDYGIALPAEVEEEGAAKRSRLFVGKRHPENQEEEDGAAKRSRLFVGKRHLDQEEEEEAAKRSRLFVGKRHLDQEEEEEAAKRSRLFVGKRHPENQEDEEGAAKRSRLFVGKRHPEEHPSSERLGTEKETDTVHGPPPMAAGAEGPTDDKRAHLFPGKRPAPGFVGKRDD